MIYPLFILVFGFFLFLFIIHLYFLHIEAYATSRIYGILAFSILIMLSIEYLNYGIEIELGKNVTTTSTPPCEITSESIYYAEVEPVLFGREIWGVLLLGISVIGFAQNIFSGTTRKTFLLKT